MAAWVLDRAADALDLLAPARREEIGLILGLTDEEMAGWRRIASRMRVPSLEDGIIAQFDGYDRLCAFRRIRSAVPTTSGQSFRGIRSPEDRCRIGVISDVRRDGLRQCFRSAGLGSGRRLWRVVHGKDPRARRRAHHEAGGDGRVGGSGGQPGEWDRGHSAIPEVGSSASTAPALRIDGPSRARR